MDSYPKTPGGKNLYELDEHGYIVIDFYAYGKKINVEKPKVEELKDEETWDEKAGIEDKNLVLKVNTKNMTKDDCINSEMTDLVRGSHYNKYLEEVVKLHLGFRQLPIKTFISTIDEHGNPKNKKFRFFPHQVKVLAFMREKESSNPRTNHGLRGGIIKLEMGMGKTLTGIAHSLISPRPPCKEKYGENGFPTLVVASKTVVLEWKTQGFDKFFGDKIKVLYFHKDYIGDSIKMINRKSIVKYDFVVTSYDVCFRICKKKGYYKEALEIGDDHSLMKGKIISINMRSREQSDKPDEIGPSVIYTTPWERVICDESQRFANPSIPTYRYVMSIYARYKWCLTGTPIKNYTTDIWSQLRFCGYNGVDRAVEWKRVYHIKMKEHKLTDAILSMDYKGAGITLPDKHEIVKYISLKDREKECYDYVAGIMAEVFDQMINKLCDFACVLALFTRLRQCSIAPYLLTQESKREKGSLTALERKKDKEALDILKQIYKGSLGEWVHSKNGTAGIYSMKITEIIKTLKEIPKNEKIIIFSMFTSVLDLVADAVKERYPGFDFVQVDGDTKGSDREELLKSFRTKINTRGLFMTYKVGSEGLNLVEARHILCVEPWWTNAVHNQAKHRVYRMGQTKEVYIHNIYVKDSIEERIVDICEFKDQMADEMLEGTGKEIKLGTGLDKYTLGRILGLRY